ncbi:hypothetical protein B566_EDAN003516 [Ephemera danica]|nr:hypothetical protein B566_EDAN003516 [Ephemera danica]
MAEFVRGGVGVILPKEKLQGSPSTGSEEGHDGAIGEEFDPFLADTEEAEGANPSMLAAPPENQITAVCGDFYIGGRQFDSLLDLIGYYTNCSDLLKRERLMHPVPPPEPVNDKKRIVAILPYTKMPDTDELSFQKGDIFFVHNDMGDGWLWVTAHRTGEQGMIFRDLVDDLADNIDPNTVFSWFHPTGPGSFLVRPSDNSPGDYSLFFHINNQIQRFRIEKKGVRYLMGGRTFECLDAVINRYRKEQIVEGHTLVQPVCRALSDTEAVKSKEIQHAEKIYATLRECREQSGLKKNKGIKMQGYLNKKSEKNKKWKNMYFVLQVDGTDTHLYFYDNPKRTKPKGLIDLSCAYLYQPLCVTQMTRSPKVQRLRELRCLQLHVLDAHRLPYKLVPNPFCIISLNQVKVARTKVKTGPDPVWDEEFLLEYERKEAELLRALNEAEIEKEEETATLLRAASLTTTLMDLYMKSVCTGFLQAAVQDTILKLLETKQSCELNPTKMESPDDACANAEFLLQVLDEVTHSIFLSAEACPRTVRYICGCLQRSVMGKWPHERLVRTRVVSGFIFLRLLCPAILNPRQFNLISEPPPPMASRSLIMVAKCLQNLANLVEFGGKEPYMEVVNPFILKNKERMVVFLDQLSSVTERPESEENRVKGDPARDLGTLHHICVAHLKELQTLSKAQPTIKKLVTVTEMLSKHKQKYLEMIR